MIIHDEIIVQPQTLIDNCIEREYKLGSGTITAISVIPAIGPNWEVFFRFLHLENAFIPDSNSDWIPVESFKLDFAPQFNDWLDVYKIKLQVCAPQAKYKHSLHVIITLRETSTTSQAIESLIKVGFR